MVGAEHVEVLLFMGLVLCHLVEVLEETILPDRLRSTLPVDKLEFRYRSLLETLFVQRLRLKRQRENRLARLAN
jgi:hypothetical protein